MIKNIMNNIGTKPSTEAPEEKRFYMTRGRERDLLKYLKPGNKNLGLKGDDIQSFTFDEAVKELMSRSPVWTEEKAKKYIQGAMDNPYEDWLRV